MNWECGTEEVSQLWSLDPSVIFLNNGSYGAVPLRVQQKREQILTEIERNPVRFLSRDLPERLNEQQRTLARWLNGDAEGFAFVPNATSGIGSVLRSLTLTHGDEIVFHNHGYRWVKQALENLASRTGVVLKIAVLDWPEASTNQICQAFEKEMSPRTKLLICDHISSPSALVFPVAELILFARSKGVPVLVDGAHAPGALELNMETLDPDFYVGNLHKWACAPRGTGFVYVRPEFRAAVKPESLCYSGGQGHFQKGVQMSDYFHWNGTTDFSAWLSTSEAIAFNDLLGWENLISKRLKLLNNAMIMIEENLEGSARYRMPSEMQGPMWTFELPLLPQVTASVEVALQIASDLYRHNRIEVPVFFFNKCVFVRVSAQAFNKLSDYERLMTALLSHPFLATRERIR